MKPIDMSRLSFLVLDFNRPKELKQTLESIRRHAKLDHEIIVHSNGGKQDYVTDYYNEGLIDRLILNKWNNGAGRGCVDLFNYCSTYYACYLEGDQPLIRDLELEEYVIWCQKIEDNKKVKFISLVGGATQGNFSQRAFFTQVQFYRELARKMPNGGPGTDRKNDTNEKFVQDYILENDLVLFTPKALVRDGGLWSVNENSDSSVWLHSTDARQVWLIKGPVKERAAYPNFSQEEWLLVLQFQSWPDGQIPEADRSHSFIYWTERNDKEIVEGLRKSYVGA